VLLINLYLRNNLLLFKYIYISAIIDNCLNTSRIVEKWVVAPIALFDHYFGETHLKNKF